jgi:hypothetical protein
VGYDCTFHLIDEKAIHELFVPRLLGQTQEQTALDRVVGNAPKLWEQVATALEGDDPESAAAMLSQLAVMFNACSLPHQYERGLALCLWGEQEADIAVEYPPEFAFSPEPLFAKVVAKYPALHGRFPDWFTGNYSTGVFIPSDRVPEVLAWAEMKIKAFAKGDQRHFKGLLGILRAAADQRLAYWEATDLAIPMANEFPGDPKLMLARYLGNEPGSPGSQVEEAPLAGNCSTLSTQIVDHWLLSGDYRPFETNVWDLSQWPPPLICTLKEFATAMARSRDGRWLFTSETNPAAKPRTFRPRLYSDLSKPCDATFPIQAPSPDPSIDGCAFVRERPVMFPGKPATVKPGDQLSPPIWLDAGMWKLLPGVPPAEARQSPYLSSVINPTIGVLQLADGSEVVIWDGKGYELRGDRFEKTFPMQATGHEEYWTSVPSGGDGFFYLSERCLFEIHRNGEPKRHAEKWKNIMFVRPGPAGSILIQEGDNKDGDEGKLYFPTDGTFVHIEPELFDDHEYRFIYWSEPTDRFIVLGTKWLAVSTNTVLSLPRYRASTGRRLKNQ